MENIRQRNHRQEAAYMGRHGSEAGIIQGLCFSVTGSQQQNLLRRHDILNAHGQCMRRNLVNRREKPGVALPGFLSQSHNMSPLLKYLAGFVKADMAVAAELQ